MARRHRVLILYCNRLFAHSLRALLEEERGLEVAIAEASGPQGSQALLSYRPQVLIVEENGPLGREEIDYIQGYVPTVIRLSLKDSAMRVSYERQVPAADFQDLLDAIRSRGPVSWRPRHRGELSDHPYAEVKVG